MTTRTTFKEYAAKYAKLGVDELLSEFEAESSAQDRCCGIDEAQECQNSLAALRIELRNRMAAK